MESSVFYESSVGKVYDVKLKVTFVSQDGSIFIIDDPYRQDFLQLSTSDVSKYSFQRKSINDFTFKLLLLFFYVVKMYR